MTNVIEIVGFVLIKFWGSCSSYRRIAEIEGERCKVKGREGCPDVVAFLVVRCALHACMRLPVCVFHCKYVVDVVARLDLLYITRNDFG